MAVSGTILMAQTSLKVGGVATIVVGDIGVGGQFVECGGLGLVANSNGAGCGVNALKRFVSLSDMGGGREERHTSNPSLQSSMLMQKSFSFWVCFLLQVPASRSYPLGMHLWSFFPHPYLVSSSKKQAPPCTNNINNVST